MNGAIRKFNERKYVSRTGIRLSMIRRHSEPHARYVIQEFVSKVRIEWENTIQNTIQNTIHVVNFSTTEESTL